MATPSYIPTSGVWELQFLCGFINTCDWPFDHSHPSGGEVTAPCYFHLHSLAGQWFQRTFCVHTDYFHVFSEEMPGQFICTFLIDLFFILLLSFRSSLYIMDTSSLSDIQFVNKYFSHSGGCLYTFLIFFFLSTPWHFIASMSSEFYLSIRLFIHSTIQWGDEPSIDWFNFLACEQEDVL